MTVKDNKDVAGKALYLEFRKDQYTYQNVVTPITVSADNSTIVPLSILRRRISTYHPRRNWSADKSRKTDFARDAYGAFEKKDLASSTESIHALIAGIYGNQFANLVNQEWELFKTPLVVEFNYEELDTIHNGKMPVSLYRRIERVRKNQGWGEDLFYPEATATV